MTIFPANITSCCSDNLSCVNLAMPPSQRSCLLCLALCIGYGSALPGLPATRDAWDRVLDQVWLKAKPRISFCLGESEAGVYSTVLDSFPKPLPTGPPGDAVCNNLAEVGRHLCGPKSLMEYYKVLIALLHAQDQPLSPLACAACVKHDSAHTLAYTSWHNMTKLFGSAVSVTDRQ